MSLCQYKFQAGQEIAYSKFLFLFTIFSPSLPTTKGGGEVFNFSYPITLHQTIKFY